ncbi:MAG: hypothetical protein MUD02_07365, partial [Bacteroidales bacterium]|nr:hypothetical protein [Bacteroidales bacterium]
ADIESFYTLVYAGDYAYPVDNDFPSPRFNHAMLCLPLDGDTLWLENTSSLLPFGYNSSQTSGRHCLVINGSKSTLVYRPLQNKEDLLVNSLITIKPETSGNGKLTIRKNLRGSDFSRYLHVKNDFTDAERDEIIRDYVGLKNEIISFSINHSGRDIPFLSIDAELRVPALLRKIGPTLVFGFPASKILKLEKPSDRTLPVVLSAPRFIRDSILISLVNLKDYTVKLPPPTDIKSDFGYFTLKFSSDEGQVLIEREMLLESGIITNEQYPRLYDFVETLSESLKRTSVIFNIKQ